MYWETDWLLRGQCFQKYYYCFIIIMDERWCSSFLCIFQGTVLTSLKTTPPVCTEFTAELKLLFHQNYVKAGFQCTVHVGSVCQTAEIVEMSTVNFRMFSFHTLSICLLSSGVFKFKLPIRDYATEFEIPIF